MVDINNRVPDHHVLRELEHIVLAADQADISCGIHQPTVYSRHFPS
ncbi:hypothetical protein MTBLM5_700004 [Magnetospirillum sp. LM-5]|nr:hypothetical protein MTBLM5_700004 [Magnetospirillum sp. LM-5]